MLLKRKKIMEKDIKTQKGILIIFIGVNTNAI
jgi:hypothetical protein